MRCLLTAVSDAATAADFGVVSIVIPSAGYLVILGACLLHACTGKHRMKHASPTQAPCSVHLYDYLAAPTNKLNFHLLLIMIA